MFGPSSSLVTFPNCRFRIISTPPFSGWLVIPLKLISIYAELARHYDDAAFPDTPTSPKIKAKVGGNRPGNTPDLSTFPGNALFLG